MMVLEGEEPGVDMSGDTVARRPTLNTLTSAPENKLIIRFLH